MSCILQHIQNCLWQHYSSRTRILNPVWPNGLNRELDANQVDKRKDRFSSGIRRYAHDTRLKASVSCATWRQITECIANILNFSTDYYLNVYPSDVEEWPLPYFVRFPFDYAELCKEFSIIVEEFFYGSQKITGRMQHNQFSLAARPVASLSMNRAMRQHIWPKLMAGCIGKPIQTVIKLQSISDAAAVCNSMMT